MCTTNAGLHQAVKDTTHSPHPSHVPRQEALLVVQVHTLSSNARLLHTLQHQAPLITSLQASHNDLPNQPILTPDFLPNLKRHSSIPRNPTPL